MTDPNLNLHLFCSKCNTEVPFTLQNTQPKTLSTTCPNCQIVDNYPIHYIGKSGINLTLSKVNNLLKTNNSIILSALGDKVITLMKILLFLKNIYQIPSVGLYRTDDGILRCICLVKRGER